MRIRAFALVLALLFAASPVLAMVCQIDCDQPPKSAACHESTPPSDRPSVRGAPHACGHSHSAGGPAIVSSIGVGDSFASLIAVPVPTLTHVSMPDARLMVQSRHGPPGLDGRRVSSRITVLRI